MPWWLRRSVSWPAAKRYFRLALGTEARAAGASVMGRVFRHFPSWACSAPATAPAVARYRCDMVYPHSKTGVFEDRVVFLRALLHRRGLVLADRLPLRAREHGAHVADHRRAVDLAEVLPALLPPRVLSAPGQAFTETVLRVFEKPSNQEVVNAGLDTIAAYFAAARPEGRADATLDELRDEARHWTDASAAAKSLRALGVVDDGQLRSLRILSGLSYGVVRPVFGDSTAIGSLMRRKLQIARPRAPTNASASIWIAPLTGLSPAGSGAFP